MTVILIGGEAHGDIINIQNNVAPICYHWRMGNNCEANYYRKEVSLFRRDFIFYVHEDLNFGKGEVVENLIGDLIAEKLGLMETG